MGDYVFNRMSAEPRIETRDSALNEMRNLLTALATLDATSADLPALRSHTDLWVLPVLQEQDGRVYSFGEIAHQLYETEYNVASFFDALQNMAPSDSDFDEEAVELALALEVQSPATGHQECYAAASQAAVDLTLCTVLSGVLISLGPDEIWDHNHLAYCANGKDFVVDHVSNVKHAGVLLERRQAEAQRNINLGSFWQTKAITYPHLAFGLDVETQIRSFSAKMLPLLFMRLKELDQSVKVWRAAGEFPNIRPNITRESKTTMDKYEADRCFRNADGDIKVFEEHIWVDSYHRVHIIRDMQAKTIEIGYIGGHLPTVKYPT
ncbi:hypothetical protein [Phyllobacterium sp. P30BS-XVII]|uniref:hypothetical protein n=1 Tax=Phyllobacterium sp. P30BS-XVII TaxID=2587046 RepID=UPI0015FDE5C6|nr:hypothetical protein [Phyllobacterium sp. P30BS-XVII]MBA8904172.1 hypothetical protein [Phyllobacterium sp. P30BS-XVII]